MSAFRGHVVGSALAALLGKDLESLRTTLAALLPQDFEPLHGKRATYQKTAGVLSYQLRRHCPALYPSVVVGMTIAPSDYLLAELRPTDGKCAFRF